jgi:hypothetical protein
MLCKQEAVLGKVWVLDTETKGTGANMVPLDRVLKKPGSGKSADPGFSFPKLKPREPSPPEPHAPRRFKVVDVQTREVLAEDVDARTTIAALEPVRSIVDVNVWAWQPERERWRLLSLDELRALWEYRGQLDGAAPALVASAS